MTNRNTNRTPTIMVKIWTHMEGDDDDGDDDGDEDSLTIYMFEQQVLLSQFMFKIIYYIHSIKKRKKKENTQKKKQV